MLTAAMIVTVSSCKKKEGCTDSTATNYDSDAETDDGSCEFDNVVEGCTDVTANNYNDKATKDDGSCINAFGLSFVSAGNTAANLTLSATSLIPSGLTAGTAPSDSWFDNVTYKGAFDASNWTAGWTLLSGYNPTTISSATKTIVDNGSGTGTVTFSKDTVYILEGFVFVNSGQVLTIEAGTVIKGKAGTGTSASALIVAKGGTIMANGTSSAPIIMTFEGDKLDGTTSLTTQGQWGGLIVLGDASLNSTPGSTQIEGIPTSEARGLYGGTNDADNSGTIKYVSIRHGGTDIGAGNEINGFTLGGVGTGTTIDYVEVIANADDGVEFFGGTANTKHLITAYCGDDSFDYDEGFRGKGQFWLTIQTPGTGDRGGEHDGGTDPETGLPYAQPMIYNATYIGNGEGRALTFRDNAGGEYHNSIFHNWSKGVDVEDLSSGEDSRKRFEAGTLKVNGCVFSSIAAGTGANDLFKFKR